MIIPLLESFQLARVEKNWPMMRGLLHSEARLESLAAVGDVLSADELVRAIQTASLRGLYSVKSWRVELAGPNIGFVEGRVRYERPRGSITDEPCIWLASELDGLIWRMRIFRDRGSAQNCLRENGVDIGLS